MSPIAFMSIFQTGSSCFLCCSLCEIPLPRKSSNCSRTVFNSRAMSLPFSHSVSFLHSLFLFCASRSSRPPLLRTASPFGSPGGMGSQTETDRVTSRRLTPGGVAGPQGVGCKGTLASEIQGWKSRVSTRICAAQLLTADRGVCEVVLANELVARFSEDGNTV